MSTDFTRVFDLPGDFNAYQAAVSWCRARRFSVGPMQGNDPIAILYGVNICIGKWRTISQAFRECADGTIEAENMRLGPVTVTIRARASAAALAAISDIKAA